MGLTNVPTFLDYIDYVVKHFGSDTVYASRLSGMTSIPKRASTRPWENFWPPDQGVDDPKWNRPEQIQSLAWTNWPLITVGLVQRGHSDATILKILDENILRVTAVRWNPKAKLS